MAKYKCTKKDRLSEKEVKKALETLNWSAFKKHLQTFRLKHNEMDEFCDYIRHCSQLICKHQNDNFLQKRNRFFNKMKTYLNKEYGCELVMKIDKEIKLMQTIEDGYNHIMLALEKCEITRQHPNVRVGSSILYACDVYAYIHLHMSKIKPDIFESKLNKKFVHLGTNIRLNNDTGEFNPDAVMDQISISLTTNILMEAYKNNWYTGNVVKLPRLLTTIDTETMNQSGKAHILAFWWKNGKI